jgi:hypothetical protein
VRSRCSYSAHLSPSLQRCSTLPERSIEHRRLLRMPRLWDGLTLGAKPKPCTGEPRVGRVSRPIARAVRRGQADPDGAQGMWVGGCADSQLTPIVSQAVTLKRITPLQLSMLLQRMLHVPLVQPTVSTRQVLSLLKHPRLFATASECAHAQACVAYVLRTAIGRSVSAVLFAALDCKRSQCAEPRQPMPMPMPSLASFIVALRCMYTACTAQRWVACMGNVNA